MSGTASKGFAITISAVDAATKQIDAINRNLKAMQAPAERLTNSFGKLAQTSGITALSHGMKDVADSSFRAFENLTRMLPALGVITGAASIAGLSRLVTGFASSGAELYRAGQRARISAGDLAAFESAADLAGSSSAAMGAGIKTLNDNMFHALQGTAPEAIVAFNTLHVAFRDAVTGGLRPMADVLPEVIQKLSEYKDPAYRAQLATMLFGGAAEGLAPVLRLTRKEFEEYTAAARLHGSITDEQAKKALALDLAQRGLAAATQGLGNAISEQLAPVLTPLLIQLTDLLDVNRANIASGLGEWVKTVIPEITEFAKQANALAQSLGGWKTILETVVAIKLGGWAVSAVTGLLPLLRVLALIPGSGVTAASLAAAGVGGVVAAVGAAAGVIALSGDTSLTSDQQSQLGTRNLGEFHEYLRANPGYRAPPPASGTEKAATAKLVHDQFRAAGYTEEQTAGVLASINRESGFDPGVLDPSGISKGLFQYTGDRRAKLERQYGQNPTAQQQVDFALKEIAPGGPEQAAGDRLRASRSATESGVNFRGGFERPANPAEPIATGQDAPKYVGLYDQGAPPANVTAAAPPANVAGGAGAAPAQPQPQTQTIKGSADLKIKISTDPGLSSKTTATTSGDVFSGAPRIEAAMAY